MWGEVGEGRRQSPGPLPSPRVMPTINIQAYYVPGCTPGLDSGTGKLLSDLFYG